MGWGCCFYATTENAVAGKALVGRAGTDNFNHGAAVGLQALHEFLERLDLAGLGRVRAVHDRISFTLAFALDERGVNALLDEVGLHGVGTTLRKLQVVCVGADAVSVAGRQDDFEINAGNAGDEVIENRTALVLERGFVKVEERISREGDLFSGLLLRSRGFNSRAGLLVENVGIASAASAVNTHGFGESRSPEAGTPAKIRAVLHDLTGGRVNIGIHSVGGGSTGSGEQKSGSDAAELRGLHISFL